MKKYSHTIDAHVDFEFGSIKPREIDYSLAIPDASHSVEGLVVFIAGFGDDAGTYREHFQKYICDNYSMACLTVDYHCIYCRPNNGAELIIEPSIDKLLREFTGCDKRVGIEELILKFNTLKANPNTKLHIPGIILPQDEGYQNFGILPALDNIYAIYDVLQKHPTIPKKIYSIGSSYGGYLANVISKLAPCTLNAVFDNSSWAVPNLIYLIGNEICKPEFVTTLATDVAINMNVLSPWSKYSCMPNALTKDRILIRSFPKNHLETMSNVGENKTVYYFVHAENDSVANVQEKIEFAKLMLQEGFKLQMEVYNSDDVDGTYIKNMDHGMGLSLQKFFSTCYEQSQSTIQNNQRTDFDFEHVIQFPCDTLSYVIDYPLNAPPRMKCISKA